jgi:hypothetical protein
LFLQPGNFMLAAIAGKKTVSIYRVPHVKFSTDESHD